MYNFLEIKNSFIMAKQSGVFSISDLNKALSKNSKFGALLSEGGGTSQISEYISTGNYLLNACMSGSLLKGIPNNRSICLSGESGCLEKNECINIYVFNTSTEYDDHKTNIE